MLPEQNRRNRWWVIFPVLGLVLVLGLVAFALRAASGGSVQSLAGGPQPNAPAGVAVNTTSGAGLPYGPAQIEKYPNGVTVIHDSKHDLSPPMRDVVPIPPIARQDGGPENPSRGGPVAASLKDTVVQHFFGPLVMPTPSLTFEGISSATSGCGCLPPDTNGDVGPNHYVQTTNSSYAIWDKNGTVVQAPRTIVTLFSGFGGPCSVQNSGDPTVNYDSLADRWLISQFTSSAPYYQCVAISQTADPTGAYYRYAFLESQTDLYDYPKTSVWPDAYYMTANVFAPGGFSNPAAFAFDRTRMLAGLSATAQVFNPGNYYYALLPADLDGVNPPPAGAPNPFISVSGNNTVIHMWKFHVDFATPANSTFTGPTNLAAAPWDPNLCGLARNCIPQPGVGTNAYLDSLGDHAMYRFAYRNNTTYQSAIVTESVDENGADHAGVRWYEIRDPAGTPSIYQQGTYAPDADHRWMPSAAMDHDGNIAVGYSVSSSTTFPSIRYAGRLASDPLGQLSQGEATLIAGTGSQTSTSGRWGDYSAMQVDPSDDCTFWYTQEYYVTTGGATWHTRIGKFKFPTCGQGQATPTAQPTTPPVTPSPTPTVCTNYTIQNATGVIVPGTTDIGNHCDDCATAITLPFAIRLYGQSFTTAYATSNGVMEFGSSDFAFGNACLPVPIFSYAVLGYWDDLITQGTGLGIFTSVTGTAPNRTFNVEWRAQVLANSSNLNFEMQFPEGSQNFSIVYGATVGQGGTSATIGVQQNGGAGAFTQFLCNTAGLTAGLQLNFTAPPCSTPVPSSPTPTQPPTATATVTPGGATPCPLQFADVPVNDPFYPYIHCLACRNILNGYSTAPPCPGGTPCFLGGNNITRGQVAKVVSNAANFTDPIPSTRQTFGDVPYGNPFWLYIERLAEPGRGYISGYSTSPPCPAGEVPCFLPGNPVTRGQMAKITANAAGYTDAIPSTRQTFTDVAYGSPFWLYVEREALHNLISGYSTSPPCTTGTPCFLPDNSLTRNQGAKIVAQGFFPNCQTPQR